MYDCTTCMPGACRSLKRASDPLGLELERCVSTRVLGAECGSSGRAPRPQNCCTISPVPGFIFTNMFRCDVYIWILAHEHRCLQMPEVMDSP